jgi:hypothetical protein
MDIEYEMESSLSIKMKEEPISSEVQMLPQEALSPEVLVEAPSILAIIQLSGIQERWLPQYIRDLKLNRSISNDLVTALKTQYEKIIMKDAAADPRVSKDITSYLFAYFDHCKEGQVLFSHIGKRYLLWHLSVKSVVEEIKAASSPEKLMAPHGVLQLAHRVNFHLATAPLAFVRAPLDELLHAMVVALREIRAVSVPSNEKSGLRISLLQIIARMARLVGVVPTASLYELASLVGSSQIGVDMVNDIMNATALSLGREIAANPALLFGGSCTVINALQTGVDKGFCSLLQCAIMYPVLRDPLLTSQQFPGTLNQRLLSTFDVAGSVTQSSKVESALFKARWEKCTAEHSGEKGMRFAYVRSTITNEVVPVEQPVRDPRRSRAAITQPTAPTVDGEAPSRSTTETVPSREADDVAVQRPKRPKIMSLEDRMDAAIEDALLGQLDAFDRIMGLINAGVKAGFARPSTGETIMIAAAATAPIHIINKLHDQGCPILPKDRKNKSPLTEANERKRGADVIKLINDLGYKELKLLKAKAVAK